MPDVAYYALADRGGCAPVAFPSRNLRTHLRNRLLLGRKLLDAAAICKVVAERFLPIDVESAFQSFDDILRVRMVGRGHVHGIDLISLGRKHLERITVDARVGTELLRRCKVFGIDIAQRRNVQVAAFQEPAHVGTRHIARADTCVRKHRVRVASLHHCRETGERN